MCYEALMQQNGCHTGVWHGVRQVTLLPEYRCRVGFFFFFFFSFSDLCRLAPIRLRCALNRADSDCIGRISVCFGRKKEIGRLKKKTLNRKYPWILIQDSRCRRHNFTGFNPFLFRLLPFFWPEPQPSVLFLFLISFVKCLCWQLKRLYFDFCASLTKHVSHWATSSIFFLMGSYTYFNTCHIYPLFCFWTDQIREPLSRIFFYLFIYLFMGSLIYFNTFVNNSSVKNFCVLITIYLLLLLLYEFSIIII